MRVKMFTFLQLSVLGVLIVLCSGGMFGCAADRVPQRTADKVVRQVEITGYCDCGRCCGWKRNWYGRPVYKSGPNEGKPKAVGVTASGARARVGTIAADTSVYPFGTVMYVPGYGYGVVEDRGGAIKGHKLDLFFNTHQQALNWGRRKTDIQVWYPNR